MNKEEVFKIIDEYEELKHKLVGIQFPKEFAEEGLVFLMCHNHTHRNGTYWINKIVQRKLDKTKIKYMVIL